jgi:gliding motility-associated-like protein
VAGTYSVFITSAGCTFTFNASLSTPNGPSLTLVSSQSVTCFNGNNGAATYSASGIGPFTFTWTPFVSNTSTATALSSGTYVLASTDIGNQCITTRSVAIVQPASITLVSTVSHVKCNGIVCDGSISVTPSGGTPAYTYTWSTGANGSGATSSVTSLCAGNYSVNVSDGHNCPVNTLTFNIVVPPAISVTSTVTNVLCNAACNGSIVANATGGTGALAYNWLPVGAFSGSTTATVLNLCPNTYTVNVQDVNSCSVAATFTITEPPALTSTIASVNEICFNGCNGTATLAASGGVPAYSFAWTSGGATTSTIGSLCAGNYTGTVIDANGCISAKGFTISSPPPFSATLTPTHPKCNAVCNGSIATALSGAQGAVSFSWSPMGSGQNPTNLCAGNYILIATDANQCQAQSVITLTNPPAILANVSHTDPACNGGCNGVAVSIPNNAVGAVQYTWLPTGPNSATNTGLCEGIFTVTLADANQCIVTQTFAISDPPTLSVNPSVGPATCGSSNGSITAVPVGGTPGYTFAWSSPVPPPIATTGSVVTNLFAGIYTVVIGDSKSCTSTVTIPLSNSNGPTAPLTATNNICNGQSLGSASVGLVTSGVGTLPPLWVTPPPSTTVNPLTNLGAGTYIVQLEDVNGCKTFTGITITEPPPIVIQPNVALPACNGVCNGSITITATGGVSPYTYTWLPGASNTSVLTGACTGDYTVTVGYNAGLCTSEHTLSIPAQSSITIAPPNVVPNNCFGDCAGSATINVLTTTGGPPTVTLSWSNGQFGNIASALCNGDYSVTVTDAQGCNDTFTVPISSPPQLTVSAAVTQPSCNLCNGAASVTAGGGSGSGYTFNWTSGATASTLTGLCAGLYQVLIKDNANCQQLQNVVINNSNGITGDTIMKQDELCAGSCNGAATVTPVGGSPPIAFSWINPSLAATGSTVSNLCAGTYFVKMTDQEGCIRTTSLGIVAATELTLSPFVTPPSCTPGGDGVISIVVAGGTPSYSYSWSPAAPNSSVISNLAPGNYSLTVTDNNGTGCSKTQVFSLSNLTGPVISSTQKNIDCSSPCNGAVTITVTGTSPVINWSVPGAGTATTVSGLCSGLVTLTVTDNGCTSVRSFSITGDPPLGVQAGVVPPDCHNSCNGSISLLPFGGTLPYTFSWTPAATNVSQLSALCSGTYAANVIDNKGCARDTLVQLLNPAAIASTVNTTNSSCSGVNDGAIGVQVLGGTAPITYTWIGPGGFTSSSQSITNVYSGTYTLSFADSLGCTKDSVVTLVSTININADAGNDTIVCFGSQVVLSAARSTGAASFRWFMVPDSLSAISSNVTYTLADVDQTYSYQLVAVSSVPGCFDKDTVIVSAFVPPYLDAGPSFTIPVFSTVVIGGNPTSYGISTVTWSPADYLDDPFLQNPVASNTIDVTYTVSQFYENGCIVSDTMQVILYPEIKISNGFSPNNDGKNDKWIIDYIEQFPDNTVDIYNRWGELLFASKGYHEPFDGTYHGRNLPVGTYYYVISLHHPAYLKAYTGPLTIFR